MRVENLRLSFKEGDHVLSGPENGYIVEVKYKTGSDQ